MSQVHVAVSDNYNRHRDEGILESNVGKYPKAFDIFQLSSPFWLHVPLLFFLAYLISTIPSLVSPTPSFTASSPSFQPFTPTYLGIAVQKREYHNHRLHSLCVQYVLNVHVLPLEEQKVHDGSKYTQLPEWHNDHHDICLYDVWVHRSSALNQLLDARHDVLLGAPFSLEKALCNSMEQ